MKDAAEFAALRSELSQFRTGSVINEDGTRGAPDKSFFKPTKLTDYFGEVLAANAIMVGYRFPGRVRGLSTSETYTLYVHLEIVFRVLG